MKPRKKRIRSIPKSRNQWGGLVVKRPGGMERDEERIRQESKRAAQQMQASQASRVEPAP